MGFYRQLGQFIFKSQYKKFIQTCLQTELAQKNSWARIQRQLSQGVFWKQKYPNFENMQLGQFQITDYEDYREILFDHFNETKSPFTGEKIEFWSESSGTTGKSKIYPITSSYRAEFQMVNGPFLYQVLQNNPSFLKYKSLYFAALHPSKQTDAGIAVGFISAYNYAKIPALLKKKYAFPDQVFCDRDTFFRWGALYALAERVDTFVAITPSMVERFFKEIKDNRGFFSEQIGTPQPPAGFPKLRFSAVEKKRLIKVLDQNSFSLQDLWPDLKTLICWKSSTCGLQLKNIKPILGTVRVIEALYAATEGWINVPFGDEDSGGALHCGGHVYEFLEVGKEVVIENLLKPWQLQENKQYEIFLTTSMGFIRFRLRDILLCKGHLHEAPILEFLEKEGQAISIGHTRVSDIHVLQAIADCGIQLPSQWFIISSSNAKSLVLILPNGFALNTTELNKFDFALQKANPEYDVDRREGLLEEISLKILSLDDPLWSRSLHAQAKPKFLIQGSIDRHS
jgi:hypothetical protein